MSDDGTIGDAAVDALVNDYIMTGEMIFLGDMQDVIDGYEERMANPCYTNNAFHHNYSDEVTSVPNCTENGIRTYTCSVCGDVHTEEIPALGHTFVQEVFLEPTCTKRGVMEKYCTVCGDSSFTAIPALGHTDVVIPRIEPTCTSVGYTQGSYCSVCGDTLIAPEEIAMVPHDYDYLYNSQNDSYSAVCEVCNNTVTEFENDISALAEAENWYNSLDEDDYTPASYSALSSVAELHKSLSVNDSLVYPQFIIDEETTAILTKIGELQPYLSVCVSGCNSDIASELNGEPCNSNSFNAVFGDTVTLTAVPDDGYKFIAWYDADTLRYLSTNPVFTYTLNSNLNISAIVASNNCSTLTFWGEGGQVKAVYSHTSDEWTELESIESLVPPVPYKYGYTNGRWNYVGSSVINYLEIHQDVNIYAEYDEVEAFVPELPALQNNYSPSLTLSYVYSNENNESVGTLIMASNVPDGCEIEEIGLAYIKEPAAEFNPSTVNLTVNSRVTSVRFNGLSDSGLYILNIRRLTSNSNWAVKGYMTYYDSNGALRIAYTNQINIVNKASVQAVKFTAYIL